MVAILGGRDGSESSWRILFLNWESFNRIPVRWKITWWVCIVLFCTMRWNPRLQFLFIKTALQILSARIFLNSPLVIFYISFIISELSIFFAFFFCVLKDTLTFFLCLIFISAEFEIKMFGISYLFPIALLVAFGLANNPVPESTFQNNPLEAAKQSSPWVSLSLCQHNTHSDLMSRLWLLPSGTCFPSAASWDGVQNGGNAPDNCNIGKLDHNCPAQPAWGGDYTTAHDFPTYYLVRKCDNLDQWRILYDVYFTKVLSFFSFFF